MYERCAPRHGDDDESFWLWTLGGPALIGVAVWSAVVFAGSVRDQLASAEAAARVVTPAEVVMPGCRGCGPAHTAYTARRSPHP